MKINKTLFLFTCSSLLLVLLRVKLTHSITYMFLIWNLFLASIPYIVSEGIKHSSTIKSNKLILVASLGCWLLFLPNAPYIVTDLIHLKHINNYHLWFDFMLISTFAINGLLFSIISMKTIYKLIKEKSNHKTAMLLIITSSFISGYGIYLGRLLRWNSWDVIQQPKLLFIDILQSFYDQRMWLIMIGFGTLLTLSNLFYLSIKKELLN